MAHSVEARVPFLDHRLVDLSIGLGNQHKIVGGDTKRVLRRGMKGILPERDPQSAGQTRLRNAGGELVPRLSPARDRSWRRRNAQSLSLAC